LSLAVSDPIGNPLFPFYSSSFSSVQGSFHEVCFLKVNLSLTFFSFLFVTLSFAPPWRHFPFACCSIPNFYNRPEKIWTFLFRDIWEVSLFFFFPIPPPNRIRLFSGIVFTCLNLVFAGFPCPAARLLIRSTTSFQTATFFENLPCLFNTLPFPPFREFPRPYSKPGFSPFKRGPAVQILFDVFFPSFSFSPHPPPASASVVPDQVSFLTLFPKAPRLTLFPRCPILHFVLLQILSCLSVDALRKTSGKYDQPPPSLLGPLQFVKKPQWFGHSPPFFWDV